jgi:hypothetical protein
VAPGEVARLDARHAGDMVGRLEPVAEDDLVDDLVGRGRLPEAVRRQGLEVDTRVEHGAQAVLVPGRDRGHEPRAGVLAHSHSS